MRTDNLENEPAVILKKLRLSSSNSSVHLEREMNCTVRHKARRSYCKKSGGPNPNRSSYVVLKIPQLAARLSRESEKRSDLSSVWNLGCGSDVASTIPETSENDVRSLPVSCGRNSAA